jgi:hypothetical protein
MNDEPNLLLQVSSVIAAGVVSKPSVDLEDTDAIAEQIVKLAKALIREAAKNSY